MITKLRTAAETAYNTGQGVQVNAGLMLALLDRLEAAEKDAARYRWMKSEVQRIPPLWDIVGWDLCIDATMGKQT